MNEALNYDSLFILAVVAFITPFLVSKLKKIKIPYQVGEIFVGIIVGKSCLNIVNPDITILFLSNLGLSYLMFLSGLEIDFSDLKSSDKETSPLWLSVKMLIVSFIVAILLSFSLKFIGINKGMLFFALIFMASAPGLVVPILKSKNMIKSTLGQVVLIFSIFCELTTLIGITIISAINANGISFKSFEFILIFIAAFILYLLAKRFLKINDFSAAAFKNLNLSVRAAFALILILVVVAEKLHSEIVLGAFLAGMIFSLLVGKAKEEISHQLDGIGYGFLIPIFFIMIGVNVDVKSVLQSPKALIEIPMFLLIFFLVKIIPSLLLKGKFGLKNALSSSMLLTAQLSLVVVAAQIALELGYIGKADYSAFILTTVLSCIIFPILFEKIIDSSQWEESTVEEDKIIVREIILLNEYYSGKALKDCKFPIGCRLFTIIRNGVEIMPTATSTLELNDLIILAGVREAVYDTMNLLTVCELNPKSL